MMYLKLLRVDQYVKNFFVFLPLFFALKMTDMAVLLKSFYAFISFCLAASAIYILNDIRDLEEDKQHPVKKNRPIASGSIQKSRAVVFMAIFFIASLAAAFLINLNLLIIIGIYLFMNILYSINLKNIAPLDLFIISTGFLLRIMAGTDFAGVTGVFPSHWIIIMTFLLSLFLAFAKRRDDVLLAGEGKQTRKSIKGYNIEFVNSAMSIMAAVIIVAYILYTISPQVVSHFHSDNIYLTVIFVILGIFRYLQNTFVYKKSGNPAEILIKDRFLQATVLCWILSFVYLVY